MTVPKKTQAIGGNPNGSNVKLFLTFYKTVEVIFHQALCPFIVSTASIAFSIYFSMG